MLKNDCYLWFVFIEGKIKKVITDVLIIRHFLLTILHVNDTKIYGEFQPYFEYIRFFVHKTG